MTMINAVRQTIITGALAGLLLGVPFGIAFAAVPFTDVEDTHTHIEAIDWATTHGVIEGFEDGSFKPDSPMTRAQFTAILHRYHERFVDPPIYAPPLHEDNGRRP